MTGLQPALVVFSTPSEKNYRAGMSGKSLTELLNDRAAIRQRQITANQNNLLAAKEYARVMSIPSGKAGGGKGAKAIVTKAKNEAQAELYEANKLLSNIEKDIDLARRNNETGSRINETAKETHLPKEREDARPVKERNAETAREKDAYLLKERENAQLTKEREDARLENARLAKEREAEAAREKDAYLVQEREVVRLENARLAKEREAEAAREKDAYLVQEREVARLENARLAKEREAEAARKKDAYLAQEREAARLENVRLAKEREAEAAREKDAYLAQEREVARLENARLAKERDAVRERDAEAARKRDARLAKDKDVYLSKERNTEHVDDGVQLENDLQQQKNARKKLNKALYKKRQLPESDNESSGREREGGEQEGGEQSIKRKQDPSVKRLRKNSESELDIGITSSSEESGVENIFLKKRHVKKNLKIEGKKSVTKKEPLFKSLTDKQWEIMTKNGDLAITNFLRNPSKYSLDAGLRKLIRENQSFLPRAATTSRLLALEVLETNRYNIFCLYHHTKDKAGKVQDGEGRFLINGVPHERHVSQSTSEALRVTPPEGYLHCGCAEEMALLDFFWWKTWSVTAEIDGEMVTEGLKDKIWTPRERMFIIEQFRSLTGLSVNDLYAVTQSDPKVIKDRLKKQVAFQLDKLNAIEAAEGIDERRVIVPALFPVLHKITEDGRDLMDFDV